MPYINFKLTVALILKWQNTIHSLPAKVSNGMSVMSTWEKIHHVMIGMHSASMPKTWQHLGPSCYGQSILSDNVMASSDITYNIKDMAHLKEKRKKFIKGRCDMSCIV